MEIAYNGANDGQGLYPEGRDPCLVCGFHVGVDWDGYLVFHFGFNNQRCEGSRTNWEVPDW